jgi:hypothetical protein
MTVALMYRSHGATLGRWQAATRSLNVTAEGEHLAQRCVPSFIPVWTRMVVISMGVATSQPILEFADSRQCVLMIIDFQK